MERLGNATEIADEAAVVVTEAKEALKLFDDLWNWPVANC